MHSRFLNSRLTQLWHGGDYSPEQWPRDVWDQDMRLMKIAGFKVATLGVFSWSELEPSHGVYRFEWLDEIIEQLSAADRYFILSTPSAAPPAWMALQYPEILRTGPDRVRRKHGNRVNYNLASSVYRQKCREMAFQLARRYGEHPRLLAWHVSNEYGGADYSEGSVEQFREWLRKKFGTLDALNAAYWTRFWGHKYNDWAEIDAPGGPYGETSIGGLTVDWQRFVTDQTVSFFLEESAPLRQIAPNIPVTTNFMGSFPGLDYRRFSDHVDFTCWDSYPAFSGPLTETRTWATAAFKHDLTRCLSVDRRWMLMECSPSSSNWYPAMGLKKPGMHRFEALQPIAHGADGVHYFQWRQSRGCQEQLHGAVVNHGTTEEGRVFQEVCSVSAALAEISEVAGSSYPAEVALIFDWESMWALDAACGPIQGDKHYERICVEHYQAFWGQGINVDVVGQDADFGPYRLVVAPMAYSLKPGFAERISDFVANGGHFVTTYLSGWTDENSLIYEEGLLGPLRQVLGIWSEEIDVKGPLCQPWIHVTGLGIPGEYRIRQLCELIHLGTAEVLGTYADDFYAGRPALTMNRFGKGLAYYAASQNTGELTEAILLAVARDAGISPSIAGLPKGVTAQVRVKDDRRWIFLMNASRQEQTVATPDGKEIHLKPWDCHIHCCVRSLETVGMA